MAWIEFHIALRDHWKIDRLAFLLECDYAAALGHLACLWCWTATNAPNGTLKNFSDKELCKAARLPLEKCLKDVLKQVKLMDANDRIHDWGKHGLKYLVAKRYRQKEYRQRFRQRDVTVAPTNHTNHTNHTNQKTIGGKLPDVSFFTDEQMHDLKAEIAKVTKWGILSDATKKTADEIIFKVKTSKKQLTNPFGYAMGIAKKINTQFAEVKT